MEKNNLKYIPLDQIIESGSNPFPVENTDNLMQDIREKGLRIPLDVFEKEDGVTFEIIDGNRRFEAIKKGSEEGYNWFSKGIPCVVHEQSSKSMSEEDLTGRTAQKENKCGKKCFPCKYLLSAGIIILFIGLCKHFLDKRC